MRAAHSPSGSPLGGGDGRALLSASPTPEDDPVATAALPLMSWAFLYLLKREAAPGEAAS